MYDSIDSIGLTEAGAPVAKYFNSEVEYHDAIKNGKIGEGEICVIAASDTPKYTCNSVDGTLYYNFNTLEYEKNGVQIANISDINAIYEAVYESLIRNNPDKKDDWNTLLKLNDKDYRLTVIQIETQCLEVK